MTQDIGLGLLVTVITVLGGAANFILSLRVRAAVSDLKAHFERMRSEDREKLRDWINGSFMRIPVVEARMTELYHRLERVEEEAGI